MMVSTWDVDAYGIVEALERLHQSVIKLEIPTCLHVQLYLRFICGLAELRDLVTYNYMCWWCD